jgi:hypothetical protein
LFFREDFLANSLSAPASYFKFGLAFLVSFNRSSPENPI